MPNVMIGIPPFVIEIRIEDLKQLGQYIRRLLRKRTFRGCYNIIAKHSGKCLDVSGASQADFANVFQYALHGGDNQC